ncbi:hypothetical protein NLI96_g13391 [Meripilus lineatus]|uniref:Uncharacterized protein n=1 Tax=Meripilus lineatus TaxID=2056292 RepID=A0AAD5UQ37_9APHY|nr:hypothetical protein NLI96_g13391 [Physisporinus lineatus]
MTPPRLDQDRVPYTARIAQVLRSTILHQGKTLQVQNCKAAQILTNHATWRTANREKRARMRAIMEARKYGRDLEAEEENAASAAKTAAGSPAPNEGTSTAAVVDETQDQPDTSSGAHGFDYSQEITTSRYNEDDTADYTHIEESDTITKFC